MWKTKIKMLVKRQRENKLTLCWCPWLLSSVPHFVPILFISSPGIRNFIFIITKFPFFACSTLLQYFNIFRSLCSVFAKPPISVSSVNLITLESIPNTWQRKRLINRLHFVCSNPSKNRHTRELWQGYKGTLLEDWQLKLSEQAGPHLVSVAHCDSGNDSMDLLQLPCTDSLGGTVWKLLPNITDGAWPSDVWQLCHVLWHPCRKL